MTRLWLSTVMALAAAVCALADSAVSGRVLDPQGGVVPGATVRLESTAGYRAGAPPIARAATASPPFPMANTGCKRRRHETQNYFDSRVTPDGPVVGRIHGTPGYPLTAVAGVTVRLGGK